MGEFKSKGYLRIKNEEDRIAIANLLYKNGYTVFPARCKKNGKTFEYYVGYLMERPDVSEQEVGYAEG